MKRDCPVAAGRRGGGEEGKENGTKEKASRGASSADNPPEPEDPSPRWKIRDDSRKEKGGLKG